MTLTYGEVADILKIIEASNLDEVVLELGTTKLVVRRGGAGGAAVAPSQPVAAPPVQRANSPSVAVTATPQPPPRADLTKGDPADAEVRAPMVGTFYRKPSPNDPPFVEIGKRVGVGEPLFLIEVMKLYNTITAPVSGTVEAIMVDDGTLVAFDQLLIVIRPD